MFIEPVQQGLLILDFDPLGGIPQRLLTGRAAFIRARFGQLDIEAGRKQGSFLQSGFFHDRAHVIHCRHQ